MTQPMASAVHCQSNPQVRQFVPMAKAPNLAYGCGKREGGDQPVSKHQIRSEKGRWAVRRGEGQLIPRRKIKIQGKNKNRDRGIRDKVPGRRKISERKPRCGDRAERCFLRQSKRETEHVRLDGRSQLPRTTYERCWWVERTESDRRSMHPPQGLPQNNNANRRA